MTRASRAVLSLLVIFTCVGCDQAMKSLAHRELPSRAPLTMLGKIVTLQYTENSGALLGVGAELPTGIRFLLLVVFAGFALAAILGFTIVDKKLTKPDIFALSIVLGGGLSNLIDRMFKGGVVIDFVRISLGPFETAIFNLADVLILSGLAYLLLSRIPLFSGPSRAAGQVENRADS